MNQEPLSPVQRIILYLKSIGISRNKFYVNANVSVGALDNDKKDINVSTLKKVIKEFPDLNLYWVVNGEGEMTKKLEVKTSQKIEGDKLFAALEKINRLHDQLEAANLEIKEWKDECRIKEAQISDQKIRINELESLLEKRNTG